MEIKLITVLVLKWFLALNFVLSTSEFETGIKSRSVPHVGVIKGAGDVKFNGRNITNTTTTQPPSHLEYNHPVNSYNVTLAYVNLRDYVAIYYDPTINRRNATWKILHEFTSNAWSYLTQTYEHLLANREKKGPFLYVILHEFEGGNGSFDDFKNPQLIVSPQYILNLGSLNPSAWSGFGSIRKGNGNIVQELDKIANKFARQLDKIANKFASLLEVTRDLWLSPKSLRGPYLVWSDIVTYDLYKNINMTDAIAAFLGLDPERFKNATKQDYIKEGSSYWFRDWFLPSYEKYGGRSVLREYFKLRIKNSDISNDSVKGLFLRQNLGEFIHIWCGVVRQTVLPRAVHIFEWGEADQTGFEKARQKYPQVTKLYTCRECNDDMGPTKATESTNKTKIGDLCTTDSDTEATQATELDTTQHSGWNAMADEDEARSNSVVIASVSGVVILLISTGFLTAAAIAYKRKRSKTKLLSPLVKGFEIPRDKIILDRDKMIGAGQFGRVIKGFVLLETEEPLPVALKYLKPGTEKLQFEALIAEVNLMANLGKHENIVGLIGTYTGNIKNHEVYLALEFCPLGNLHDYLLKNRNHFEFRSQITAAASASNKISTTDLLGWALNISNAMVYLSSKKVIHRDLATRNVLLTENRTAKISDFGLSKDLPPSDTYTMTSTSKLPWKWMAIESFTEDKFSTPSDVWSFGVTLWEIFSLSTEPYASSTCNKDFIRRLSNGGRLLRPPYASQEVYNLMTECWKMEPSERPSFSQVHSVLQELINPCHGQLQPNESVQISGSYV